MASVRDGIFLEDYPPVRSQFRRGRRDPVRSVIVVHTAESGTDLFGSDPKAEGVAEFIRRRTTPGSYHLIGDRDSIIQLVRFDNEAFHDRTGSNRWSLAISLAMNASSWPNLSADVRAQFVATAAQMAVRAARWLEERGLPLPEPRLLSKTESEREEASGFISHARRDPSRRTDPGSAFPWSDFFTAYQQQLSDSGLDSSPQQLIRQLQRLVGVRADGIVGPVTRQALNRNWLGDDDAFDPSVADRFANNPRLVEWVQARVNVQPGFAIAVDGSYGRRTATAVGALLGRGGVVTAESYLLLADSANLARAAAAPAPDQPSASGDVVDNGTMV